MTENDFWDIIKESNNDFNKFLELLESYKNNKNKYNKFLSYYDKYINELSKKLQFERKIIKQMLMLGETKVKTILEDEPDAYEKINLKNVEEHKSKLQVIKSGDTKEFGKTLILDGDVQVSEKYEYIYHEMMVHPSLVHFLHDDINVLIIGGGDGGTLKQVLFYNNVKKVTMIELDESVIETSKKIFPGFKDSFEDSRLELIIGDGFDFIKKAIENNIKYNVILIDTTDSDKSNPLYTNKFFRMISKSLLEEKHMVALNADLTIPSSKICLNIKEQVSQFFKNIAWNQCYVPFFNNGNYCFLTMSNTINPNNVIFDEELFYKKKILTKYYSPSIHKASSVLHRSLSKKVNEKQRYVGKHYLINLEDSNFDFDKNIIKELDKLVKNCGLNVLKFETHFFENRGLTGFYLLSQSHLSFHTWPEFNYCTVDVYTCGNNIDEHVLMFCNLFEKCKIEQFYR